MVLLVSRTKPFETEVRKTGEHALVMLAGELDVASASQLYAQFAELTQEGITFVDLNLAELEFIDSTGLSAIIAEHKRVRSMQGELTIFSPRPRVRKVFEISGLDGYLTIRPAKDE